MMSYQISSFGRNTKLRYVLYMCVCKSTHTSSFSSPSSTGTKVIQNITAEDRLSTADQSVNINMMSLSQVWSQWEEDRTWSDSLLRRVETSFPMMHEGGDCGQQISEKLSVYQVILANTQY